MKKLVIMVGVVIVLINSITLYVTLRLVEPTVRYRVILANNYTNPNILYISDGSWAISARYSNANWVNIDAGTAARIAHMLILDGDAVIQPYRVFYDDENDVFIVIANFAYGEDVIRVVVCRRTGGILLNSITRPRAWSPHIYDMIE